MAKSFEELDYTQCALGELILRRRRPVSMPDTWIYEVKLNGNFLMSSLVNTSEKELARLGLAAVDTPRPKILVGGLGLGYTAEAALATATAAGQEPEVEILEFLPEVIAWHQNQLVPLGAALTRDPRVVIRQGDCFAHLLAAPPDRFDAILLDIDDGPEEVLHDDHRSFYGVDNLRRVRETLRPRGSFALWTSRPTNPAFLDRLRQAYPDGEAVEVTFHNVLLSVDEINTIYVGHRE